MFGFVFEFVCLDSDTSTGKVRLRTNRKLDSYLFKDATYNIVLFYSRLSCFFCLHPFATTRLMEEYCYGMFLYTHTACTFPWLIRIKV